MRELVNNLEFKADKELGYKHEHSEHDEALASKP
jgi:hypothetical protein